ncbi:MAG: S41 family peptidase [Chlamydiales bacterium]|nr:S41 family peptidase [Chlamydiales bacterium]
MLFRLISLFLLFFSPYLLEAKPPALSSRDTKIKIEEILKAHVCYQSLTPELIKRSIENYLDEIDPSKAYFIDSEIVKWTNPSEELLTKTLEGCKKEDFSTFEAIHETFLLAVQRRARLEEQVLNMPITEGVQPSEFKDIKWAKSEDELLTRLSRIRSLQLDVSDKLDREGKDKFYEKLTKRRKNREAELTGASTTEKKQIVYSYVLKAITSALDSQTVYFTPTEANQFLIQVQQRLFGIGVQLRDDLSGFSVVKILDGGPANQSKKLKVNDRIIAVNGEPVVGMDIAEAVELIRGQKGTSVLLTVLRPQVEGENKSDEKLDVEITRGEVVLKETRLETSYEPYGDGVIGVLHLFSFYQDSTTSSAADLAKAIEDLKKAHNLKGIVLDLRDNSGGLLSQAVSVSGLFITKGVVVSVKDNTGASQRLRNIEAKPVWDGPLIIAINRASASSAEIVAQALQDYGRTILVGDKESFGKGTFQSFTLESANFAKVNPKGEYKVTRGRYYTVSGKSPQLTGVQADIVVPGILSELEIGEKFSKFPVGNDQIEPSFEDDLSDIPYAHRDQIAKLYRFNLQPILKTYQPYLPVLAKNSQDRIEKNKNYQTFLKEIAKKDNFSEEALPFGQADLQLEESINIMKDLIFLMNLSK